MSLVNCRVVLVRPQVAGNIGATARVMHNFGLSQLVLVAPEADPQDHEARQRSTQGEHILRAARIVADLGEALGDCALAAATSARLGGLFRKQALGPPDEIAAHLLDAAASGPVALVFGPEPTGLTNEEVARCNYLIHIPTNPEYPALNLAQAVAICLYELRRASLKRTEVGGARRADAAPLAEQERMFAHLQRALEAIHFLYGPKAESLMFALRHLIGRAGPTEMEVDVLFGLARQIHWYVDHGNDKSPQHE
jgi:tRNA/rRNA methyltransferase